MTTGLSQLRSAAPVRVKTAGRRIARGLGSVTAHLRLRPSFLVVGAQRCGTTSLHRALVQHPGIAAPVLHKGVHYFDVNYGRGERWYAAHFPLRRPGDTRITGESSPYYMFHPAVPGRIAADLPGVRLLVMLRDPVERAYSAHRHELARGFETEDFETALALEDERLAGEEERLLRDPSARSRAHQHHAYLRRGHYAEQVRRLHEAVGADNVLVLDAQDVFTDPEPGYRRALSFLGLPPSAPPRFPHANARPRSPLPAGLRARLEDHFAPHDAALEELLGWTPTWRRR